MEHNRNSSQLLCPERRNWPQEGPLDPESGNGSRTGWLPQTME